MEGIWRKSHLSWLLVFVTGVLIVQSATGQLSSGFYDSTCPNVLSTVKSGLDSALSSDGRVGASLLRVHFHDCFVDGCDGSILLDPTDSVPGEKNANANGNSINSNAFTVVDNVKATLENDCPGIVSCADILAILARDGVVADGGPSWDVQLGRRDSLTASQSNANSALPAPTDDVSALTSAFTAVGLDQTDMVALSGGHTFGKASCAAFRTRLWDFEGTGAADPNMDPDFVTSLKANCPEDGSGDGNLFDLDQGTGTSFDNQYYNNLLIKKGLLHSDQVLETTSGNTQDLVSSFGSSQSSFESQFASSMIKMGNISPKTGTEGEIRTNCRVVN